MTTTGDIERFEAAGHHRARRRDERNPRITRSRSSPTAFPAHHLHAMSETPASRGLAHRSPMLSAIRSITGRTIIV
jgi:hypothetical protein